MPDVQTRIKALENETGLLWQRVHLVEEKFGGNWEQTIALVQRPPGIVSLPDAYHIIPITDEQVNLGDATHRFGTVYAVNISGGGGGTVDSITDQDGGANIMAARSARANHLLALNGSGKFPGSAIDMAHSQLTGVTADQHHAGLVALDGDSGTAVPDGSDTIKIHGGSGLTSDAAGNTLDVDMGIPGTLTTTSSNMVSSSSHWHNITTTYDGYIGGVNTILQSDSDGDLTLRRIHLGHEWSETPDYPLHITSAGEQARINYDSGGYFSVEVYDGGATEIRTATDNSTGNLTLNPAGHIITGGGQGDATDVLPGWKYQVNIGAWNNKYLSLYCAELWVETLVAAETVATIGGRILVGPTTMLSRDLTAGVTTIYVKHNEMVNGDTAYLEGNGLVEFISIDSNYTISGYQEIYNGGFETADNGGWYAWYENAGTGSYVNETTIVHSGNDAVKLIAGSSKDTWIRQACGGLTAATPYILRFWTRAASNKSGRYAIEDVNHSEWIIPLTITGVAGTSYKERRIRFKTPVGCTNVRVFFWCPDLNGDVCYYDDATLTIEEYYYTVTRDLDGTGSNDWKAGDAVFNTGATGDGFIDLYSVHGVKAVNEYGPSIVGNVRNSTSYNDWSEYWAIGNLNGIYGYSATTYGVALGKWASGNSHITIDGSNGIQIKTGQTTVVGQWATNGNITVGRTTATNITVDTTNGVQIKYGGSTVFGQWATNGTITVGRVAAGQGNVYISSGAIELRMNTVTMLKLQTDGDAYFGDIAANKANMFWDVSAGKLLFRGGSPQTTQIEIATSGALTAGGGTVKLDSNGLILQSGEAANESVIWKVGMTGDTTGWIYSRDTNEDYLLSIQAGTSTATERGIVRLRAVGATYTAGFYVLGEEMRSELVRADLWVNDNNDVRVSGGIYAGGIGVDPGVGAITCTATCSAQKFTDGGGGYDFFMPNPARPDEEMLRHWCIETDGMRTLYTGRGQTDGSALATIELPDWFAGLAEIETCTLTAVNRMGKLSVDLWTLQVESDQPNQEFCWLIVARRVDALAQNALALHPIVEPRDSKVVGHTRLAWNEISSGEMVFVKQSTEGTSILGEEVP